MQASIPTIVTDVTADFVADVVSLLPRLLSGVLFVGFAYLAIRLIRGALDRTLSRIYPGDQRLIADFILLVVTVFLWFWVALSVLKILGMGDIAASMGTVAGFIALGVSYALSDMIEDAVAGVYLLRDPDFNPGDSVTTASITGTVTEIGLRKSRFRIESGDTVVLANTDVEKKWTKESATPPEDAIDGP